VYIKNAVPDFEMIFVGGGPDEKRVKVAAEKYEWVHFPGPKIDEEKVPYFMLSRLFLMPGLVVSDFGCICVGNTTNNDQYFLP
jgi:precorrin-6B methylase 2